MCCLVLLLQFPRTRFDAGPQLAGDDIDRTPSDVPGDSSGCAAKGGSRVAHDLLPHTYSCFAPLLHYTATLNCFTALFCSTAPLHCLTTTSIVYAALLPHHHVKPAALHCCTTLLPRDMKYHGAAEVEDGECSNLVDSQSSAHCSPQSAATSRGQLLGARELLGEMSRGIVVLMLFMTSMTVTVWAGFDVGFTAWLHKTFGFGTTVGGKEFLIVQSEEKKKRKLMRDPLNAKYGGLGRC